MEPIDLLTAITGHVEAAGAGKSVNQPAKLATIDPLYTSGSPRVTFDGESTMSVKAYPYVESYSPRAGDRVILVAVGTTYLILGAISTGTAGGVPAGSLQLFAGSTAPSGWLLCTGQAVSRTAYARLYAAIGTTWGSGDGSTTFNVPDMRGRVPVGVGTGAGLTARTLGASGGAETHTLSEDQLAAHDHSFSGDSHDHTFSPSTHYHTGQTDAPVGTAVYLNNADGTSSQTIRVGAEAGRWSDTLDGTGSAGTLVGHEHPFTTDGEDATGTIGSAETGGAVGSTGSGSSVDHMPPFRAMNYMIKC